MHVQRGAVEHQGAQDRIPLALSQQEERPGWEDGESAIGERVSHQRVALSLQETRRVGLDSCELKFTYVEYWTLL